MKSSKYDNSFRPVALSLGGFDPSAGAGVLADVKTFELNKVYGIAVNTCVTIQNDIDFASVRWCSDDEIIESLTLLSDRYDVKAAKLGMHRNIDEVLFHVELLKQLWPKVKIVWDPVMASSSGFDLKMKIEKKILEKVLSKIDLVTPNLPELEKLRIENGGQLSGSCAYLVKGGHANGKDSEDLLFEKGKLKKVYRSKRIAGGEKHGSGCVLSSAVASGLAKGNSIQVSIVNAKKYINNFLKSNKSLSGYHTK
jgi:hydroxymethylpyrimidine/phosphomethylpyrimidine kinase